MISGSAEGGLVLLPGSPTIPPDVVLTAAGAALGLVAALLCTAAALHCLRRDRPLVGLALLLAGPTVLLSAQVVGAVQVAVALAVVLPVGAAVRLATTR